MHSVLSAFSKNVILESDNGIMAFGFFSSGNDEA